jgi:hypothetical protein
LLEALEIDVVVLWPKPGGVFDPKVGGVFNPATWDGEFAALKFRF